MSAKQGLLAGAESSTETDSQVLLPLWRLPEAVSVGIWKSARGTTHRVELAGFGVFSTHLQQPMWLSITFLIGKNAVKGSV